MIIGLLQLPTLQPSFDDERRFELLLESWHAIKKLFNLPFLTLKIRYPAVSYVIGFSLLLGLL